MWLNIPFNIQGGPPCSSRVRSQKADVILQHCFIKYRLSVWHEPRLGFWLATSKQDVPGSTQPTLLVPTPNLAAQLNSCPHQGTKFITQTFRK